MAFSEAQAMQILDFAQPFSVPLLEGLVGMMYTSTNPQVCRCPTAVALTIAVPEDSIQHLDTVQAA